MDPREKNAPAKYGKLAMQPIGAQPDDEKYETLTINAAPDSALVTALALRGYDVTVKAVTPEVAAKRKAAYDKKQAAKVRRAAKASPSI